MYLPVLIILLPICCISNYGCCISLHYACLSQYNTYFYPFAVPPYQSHEVTVTFTNSLLIDRDVNLIWSNDFSTSVESVGETNALTFRSTILLHVLPASGENDKLATHTILDGTTRNTGAFVSHGREISNFVTGTQVVAGSFEVVTTVTGVSTTDSFSFSKWSGVYLIASQSLSNTVRIGLGSMCNVSDQGDTTLLPACPTTEFQALLFNSGFDEEVVVSVELEEAMYREQYYGYLHPKSKACYVQRQLQSPK